MPNLKLIKKNIDKLKPESKDIEYWDTDDQGFFLKVTPAGKKSFFLFYRNKYGQKRKAKIGDYGPMTPDEARALAIDWLGAVQHGEDPAMEKKRARRGMTVRELSDTFLNDHVDVHKKESSASQDRYYLKSYILPRLGQIKAEAVTRAEILKFHTGMKKTPITANRCLALLSKMFSLAEAWGIRTEGTNPCRLVQRFPENRRERYLDGDELSRVAQAIDELEQKWNTERPGEREPGKKERDDRISPAAAAAFRLLLLTGCRCGEILSLRWEHVDLEDRCLRLPDSKTGAKTVYLNDAAMEILEKLPHAPSGWVIPGAVEGNPMVNLQKPWRRVITKARVSGLRLHDLRHSYASVAAGLNLGLPIIGKLLGHTQAQTTHRYAHLMDDPLRAAVNAIGNEIAQGMKSKGTNVVEVARVVHPSDPDMGRKKAQG